MKLWKVLLFYSEYFSAKKDTCYLERILNYFNLMDDNYNLNKLINRIL